jgi:ABC-2 type transport system permease protein
VGCAGFERYAAYRTASLAGLFTNTVFGLLRVSVLLAVVAYFPALAVLDKPDPLGLPHLLRYAAPPVALATAAVAALIWRGAVRHYQGVGS